MGKDIAMTRLFFDRRTVLAAGLGVLAAPGNLMAQAWPQGRTVRLVVPFPPGGATDVLGRLMADKLGQAWGRSLVVENKPGAGANIGIDHVVKAEPNGDTLIFVGFGLAANQFLYNKLTYDPVTDLAPIAMVASVPNLLAIGNHLPFKSVLELIDFGKANPGKLTYASSGVGTSVHLSGELFQKLAGVKMVHVPYRGSAQATLDLIGGRVDLIFDNAPQILPHIRAGAVRGLGISTTTRSASAPEFPPIADTLPGFDVTSWFALFAPAKTPPTVIARIQADATAALMDAGVREKMAILAAEPMGSTSAELGAFLKAEIEKWGRLIKDIGIKVE
jgi:tripartite-type tricarboxylate transporter receptor subunit TctC